MPTVAWVKDMLGKRGVAYEELHHRVAFTAQEVARDRTHQRGPLAKVVVIIADGRPVELILPASRRGARPHAKAARLDAVRLASEAEMERIFTDCETGAIPPLRHWKDVPVLMDASMSNAEDVVFQAGTHEDVIRLKFQDWIRAGESSEWNPFGSRSTLRTTPVREPEDSATCGRPARSGGRGDEWRAASPGAGRAERRGGAAGRYPVPALIPR